LTAQTALALSPTKGGAGGSWASPTEQRKHGERRGWRSNRVGHTPNGMTGRDADRLSLLIPVDHGDHLQKLLSFVGYKDHLETRLRAKNMAREVGYSQSLIRPIWNDLMLWAVMSGQPELALSLWKKTQV